MAPSSRPASAQPSPVASSDPPASASRYCHPSCGQRRLGLRSGQRALEVAGHEPPGDAEQERDEQREQAAVERREADAERERHTR